MHTSTIRFVAVTVAICVTVAAVPAQTTLPTTLPANLPPADQQLLARSIRIPFTTVPMGGGINVDGDIRKGEWVHYTQLQDFVSSMDQSEDNGAAAPQQTRVLMTYDEQALYVGFKMFMESGV